MAHRTGIGYDVHRLEPGVELWLGGVLVPSQAGLAGHSDGDVLLHAVVDAMLGAAALGDIGQHFPSSDPTFKRASSLGFLRHVASLLEDAGWRVVNLDATIVAERPRLAPHIPTMRQTIAETLGLTADQVSIKCTTTDGLGSIGRGEGMAALAIATVEATK